MALLQINTVYWDEITESVIRGTAVAAGDRFLTLCTDGSYTEATTITRKDLDTFMTASASGVSTNDIPLEFTGLDADDYTHWAVCSHITDPLSTSWVYRGSLEAPLTVLAGGAVIFAPGYIDLLTEPGT
jgi:hypothetical protein